MALKERTTGSHPGSSAPTSDLAAIIDELDGRFENCKTHRQRLTVIKDAQAIAIRLTYAPRKAIQGDKEWKQKIINDPRSSRVLAGVYGVSHMTIARIKKQARC